VLLKSFITISHALMRLLYTLSVYIYTFSIHLATRFNSKALLWVNGRKEQYARLEEVSEKSEKWLWFHAASLGEFEQGRPVIEACKQQFPDYAILLTFFSPSGYEIRKDYQLADCVAYLPADTLLNARRLLSIFKPKAAFFVKYEFWFNYMYALNRNKIPLYYISARFRKGQHFFAFYGYWFRKQLKNVKHFFVQDKVSASLIDAIGLRNYTITGDTRFDRVASLAATAKRFGLAEHFKGNNKLIIAGSTWPPDESLLLGLIPQLPENYKLLIAPHDVGPAHITSICQQLTTSYQLYSQYNEQIKADILVLDSIGILSQLYQYADFVYVGGGFGQSIHNIQEPVTFGCPVIFGPNYHKFTEANDLIRLGGAFCINNAQELIQISLKLIHDRKFREESSHICKNYVAQQSGATKLIVKYLEENFFGEK